MRHGTDARDNVAAVRIQDLPPAEIPAGNAGLEKLFTEINRARLLVFLKSRDSHNYKFSSTVLEDY